MSDSGGPVCNGNDYLELPGYASPWVIKNVIPSGGAVNLYGIPKAGKSFAALGMAFAIANPKKQSWLGFSVEEHGRVFYLQVDTPRTSWQNRVKRIMATEADKETMANMFFADKLQAPRAFNVMEDAHARWLEEKLIAVDPLVVFVDVLREVHQLNENDSGDMKVVLTKLFGIIGGRATVLLSHARKEDPKNPFGGSIMNDQRGSNYVPGRMDVVMCLTDHQLAIQGRDVEKMFIRTKRRPTDGMIIREESQEESEKADEQLIMILKTYTGKGMSRNAIAKLLQEETFPSFTVDALNKRIARLPKSKAWNSELSAVFKGESWFGVLVV